MKSKKRTLNVRLLRRIQRQILAEPLQFQMRWLYCEQTDLGRKPPNCGTAACIAGWAVALAEKKTPAKASLKENTAWEKACQLLGIERGSWDSHGNLYVSEQSKRLFQVEHWPSQFRTKYNLAEYERQQAKVAVARIEHFIKTKGRK